MKSYINIVFNVCRKKQNIAIIGEKFQKYRKTMLQPKFNIKKLILRTLNIITTIISQNNFISKKSMNIMPIHVFYDFLC